MDTNDEILRKLQLAAQAKKEVTLINAYRGVPISYDATILSIDENTITLRVHQYQAVCLELTRQTFIKSDLLPTIKAWVKTGNIEERISVLTDFKYADDTVGNRNAVRVKPKEPIPVTLTKKQSNKRVRAELADVSAVGIGVYWFSVFVEDSGDFFRSSNVSMTFRLPDIDRGTMRELTLHGTIMNVIPIDKSQRYRIGMRIMPNTRVQPIVSQYVAQRQTEIIREVKLLHSVLIRLARHKRGIFDPDTW